MTLKTKRVLRKTVLVAAMALTLDLNVAHGADDHRGRDDRRTRDHRVFALGICVGQTLATQNPPVILPVPTQGQSLTPPDATTQAAIDAAIKSCIDQLKGNNGGGSGNGGSGSTTPSPSPGLTPNPSATPDPTPSSSPSPGTNSTPVG